MTGFLNIRKILLPRAATTETQKFLRATGQRGNEGLVLWCGKATGESFEVTNILIPRQQGVRNADGVCAYVHGNELHRINMELYESGLRLIAQVHSHPTEAYHSDTDDEYAIVNTVGSLSLVVPDFAKRDFSLRECAVYRLSAKGAWEDLSSSEVEMLIEIQNS